MLQPNLQSPDFAEGTVPTDRIDVWTVALDVAPEQVDRVWEWLSPDERDRAARFAFERDRRRFVVGRGALRNILASYRRVRPAEIRFAYGEHGKPRLAESDAPDGLEFNASGSGELAACAVTARRAVGVDIELCRPVDDNAFVEECLSPAERQLYRALPPTEKPAAFYRLWTLKEAYLKARGTGLSQPLSSLEVAFPPGEPARLLADRQPPARLENWTFVEFLPGPTYAGALVVAGTGRPIHYRRCSL